jgi:peptidyl-prolyl cis-trans isomerase B (cyclophilin B)
LLLLALSALTLAACGDGKETASGGGAQTATETTATTAPTETDAGSGPEADTGACRKVAQPKPKQDGGRTRPSLKIDRSKTWTAVLDTNCGQLEIELDAQRAPKTVASFVALARSGYFDGLTFHRIVPGFVVQGGDPAGTGQGGPGYSVTEAPPKNLRYERGVVAMAKTELERPGTSGSQFFIVTGPDAQLPPDYALLGRVKKGDDVLTKIEAVPADPTDQRPQTPIVIEKVTIRSS